MLTDLADRIAAWALAFEPDAAVRARARASVLDFAACARAGLRRPEIEPFRRLAGRGDVPLWLGAEQCDGAGAALLHGVAGSLLQLHDVHADLGLHACSAVIPAAWAMAWRQQRSRDGAGLVAAVAAGYEATYRIAAAGAPGLGAAGGSVSGMAGALGAAVAAARLAGLDRRGIARALGIASLTLAATPTRAMRAHASAAPLHGGIAARCGFEAASLAQSLDAGGGALEGDGEGPGLLQLLRGDPRVLEPERWDGTSFARLGWKLAPGCVAALPAVEAARALRQSYRGEIETVQLGMQARLWPLIATGPHGEELYDRLMSVRWLVARALTAAPDEPEAALDPHPAATRLAQRVTLQCSPTLEALAPTTLAVDLVVDGCGGTAGVRHRRPAVFAGPATAGQAFTWDPEDPALRTKRQRLAAAQALDDAGWRALCEPLGASCEFA